jgi:phosphate/sulfate permease
VATNLDYRNTGKAMFLFFVIALFALAVTDLVVGVSNDAVNFLNSAVGSKAGSRRAILIVAAMGIFAGALFSSGMMEVARKGIFNPQMFAFSDVMIIFLAVMLTDILLLDLFNTFGMPTSTTVSIVFELLGAAVMVAFIKLVMTDASLSELPAYINTSKAISIITWIFISIAIAFTIGAIGQFISRLIFGFHYKQRMKKYGGIWGGIALTILSYFLLIKGLKGASFMSADLKAWLDTNSLFILIASFVFWTSVFQLLITYTKVNVLRVIVMLGTFSLAMAFASNDLVNFIGVPIAGFESFNIWKSSGQDVNMLMTSLGGKVQTPFALLSIAGIVMVITLWRSKKARTVTATEVNLGRQDIGEERFRPHFLAVAIVRFSIFFVEKLSLFIPKKLRAEINKKYRRKTYPHKKNPPAFDLVRASVNLTLASMLIAIATMNKLPLSTTYVSFMVAMGTSLADKAWGGSAEYRIAGVINVVGGWLLTALIAFIVAGIFALVIFKLKMTGVLLLLVLLVVTVYLLHRKHQQKLGRGAKSGVPELFEI